MPLVRFLGFPTGSSVSLVAGQGAETAEIEVAPWNVAKMNEALAISVLRHRPDFRRAPEAIWVEAMPSGFTGLTQQAQIPAPAGPADWSEGPGLYPALSAAAAPRTDGPAVIRIASVQAGQAPAGVLFEAGGATAGLAAAFDADGALVVAAGDGAATATGFGAQFLRLDAAWFVEQERDIWVALDPVEGRMRVYVVDPASQELLTMAQGDSVTGEGLGTLAESPFVDAFNRADQTLTASADWEALFDRVLGAGSAEIVSNRVDMAASVRRQEMLHVYAPFSGGADQFAEFTLDTLSGFDTMRAGPAVLVAEAGAHCTGYAAVVPGGGPDRTVSIARIDGDSGDTDYGIYLNYLARTDLATTSATIQDGDVLRLEADGTGDLRLKVNGVVVLSATDTTYTSGKPGFYTFHSRESYPLRIDDFACGQLGTLRPIWADDGGLGVGQANGETRAGVTTQPFVGTMGAVSIWGGQLPDDFAATPPVRYQPEFHEIFYEWDCVRDDGLRLTHSAPRNVPAEFLDASRPIGKMACFVIDQPGNWTITCTARQIKSVEPLTFVETTGSTALTVGPRLDGPTQGDPLWTANTTIVMSADGDFTGAPAGHQVVYDEADHTAWKAAVDAARATRLPDGTRAIRILLKRGETGGAGYYNGNFLHDRDGTQGNENFDHIFVGSWGVGANPVTSGLEDHGFTNKAEFLDTLIFDRIDIQGSLDHVLRDYTGDDAGKDMFWMPTREGALRLFNKVHLRDRWGIGFYLLDNSTDPSRPSMTVINDCACDGVTDYGVFGEFGDTSGGKVAILGFRHVHPPAAPRYRENEGPGTIRGRNHGPVRISGSGDLIVDGCDFFSRLGWTGGQPWPDGTPSVGAQPCIRLASLNSPLSTTGRAVVSRCVGEGDGPFATFGALPEFEVSQLNLLVDGNVHFRSAGGGIFGSTEGGAVTFRNNMFVFRYIDGALPLKLAFRHGLGARAGVAQEQLALEPVAHYGNSVVVLGAQGTTFEDLDLLDDVQIYTVSNNVIFAPDIPGQPGHANIAPVDDSELFPSRYVGRWEGGYDPGLVTAYATPDGAVSLYAPLPGSAIEGEARAGYVGLFDLLGRPRWPEAAPGALQVP